MPFIENVNNTDFNRRCLLKYITSPFYNKPCNCHQNMWQVPMLASLIGEYSFDVDAMDWDDETVRLTSQYDLVLDIDPHNSYLYEPNLNPGCRRVLYATGSAPEWQKQQEDSRLADLQRRRGITLPPRPSANSTYAHPSSFDALFLIGNQQTLSTFENVDPEKVSLIRNTGYYFPLDLDFSQKSPRDFLFFASWPQTLKGLDLLLEVFAANPSVNLYVCSLFPREPEFCRAYGEELVHQPNIKAIGFIDPYGPEFRALARECAYLILPSCSEGISGSVLAGMSAGLIPLVSRYCGLDDDQAEILPDCSIEGLSEAVRHYAEKSGDWIRRHTFQAMETIRKDFSPTCYIRSVQAALQRLLGPVPEATTPPVIPLVKKRSAVMIANTRVGIPLTGCNGWYGGVSYVETLVKSIAILPPGERPKIYLVLAEQDIPDCSLCRPFVHLFDGVLFVGRKELFPDREVGCPAECCANWDELFSLVDVYYPVNSELLPYPQAIPWIPDFQHRHLPEFFAAYDYQRREAQFQKIAAESRTVIVNSKSAEKDFKEFYPAAKASICVLPACPLPQDNWYTADPVAVQRKYGLPDRFVLCSNQFWIHKNHLTLFLAMAQLQKQGIHLHLVCTGAARDYRTSGYFDHLQAEINRLGINEQVSILGHIPREDQIQLLRRSLFGVQPSLFEGLSLFVQECRALGKAVVMSDLDVHLESGYGTTFSRNDANDLAAKIANILFTSQPGPDVQSEAAAKERAIQESRANGRAFCSIISSHLGQNVPEVMPSPTPPSDITVVTSLSESNLPNQQIAIQSWQKLGFKVVAVNNARDAEMLRSHFPGVEFRVVYRDAAGRYGKSCIYFNDLLDCCSRQATQITGIVKSDIIFTDSGLPAFLARESADSLIFGSRLDVDSAESPAGTLRNGGFDYLFFDRPVTRCFPREGFCFGLPWWDYWATLMPIAYGIPAKWLVSPVARHVRHPVEANHDAWTKLGILLSRYAETDFAITGENLAEYQQLLFTTIRDNSTSLHFAP